MNTKNLKKKILYQASHRGNKESDIILGEFSKKYINHLSESELQMLMSLLEESDLDILGWITKKSPIPRNHNNQIIKMLSKHFSFDSIL